MCSTCSKLVYAGWAKMKSVTTTWTKSFVCEQCVETIKNLDKELYFPSCCLCEEFLLFGGQIECQWWK